VEKTAVVNNLLRRKVRRECACRRYDIYHSKSLEPPLTWLKKEEVPITLLRSATPAFGIEGVGLCKLSHAWAL